MSSHSNSDLPKRVWRLEGKRSVGWIAQYVVEGVAVRKFFGDARYGSSRAAREAAMAYARTNVRLHLEFLSLRRRLTVRRNNTSGFPGIARYESSDRGPFWVAFWDDEEGVKRQKQFCVSDYGEDGAHNKARACRRAIDKQYRERFREVQKLLTRKDTDLVAARLEMRRAS